MTRLQAVYYRDSDGREPVSEFLLSVNERREALLRGQIGRIDGLTPEMPHLPFSLSSQVDGELRELRCHVGSEHYRVLYRRSENLVVLLHAFRKSTPKLPRAEVDLAHARWNDYRARMDADPRQPPRPAGRDAP